MWADHNRESCESAAEWNVPGFDAVDAERLEPALQLTGSLVCEGHREDP